MEPSKPIVAVLCAVLLAACSRDPPSVKEGMILGAAALRAGDLAKAEDLFTATFRMADKAGNESYAVFAGDFAADLALKRAAPDRALTLYERMASRYPEMLLSVHGRFRIPNNLGVLMARAGRLEEGMTVIEHALAQFEGHGVSPAYPFAPRAFLAGNLVRMNATHDWNPRSEALLQSTLVWLERDVDMDRSGQFSDGAHALFAALGDFVSHGPRPAEAARWYARAEEAAARQYSVRAQDSLELKLCEPRGYDAMKSESCYEIYE